jgi:hypothetical protein
MITDGNWVCARCLDYRTICQLCEGMCEDLIRTPQYIKDQEDKLNRRLNPRY